MWNQSLVMKFLKINNNVKLQYTLACYQDSDGKSGGFFECKISPKCEKWKGFCKKLSNFQPKKKKSLKTFAHIWTLILVW
jgi:hypothetical protein